MSLTILIISYIFIASIFLGLIKFFNKLKEKRNIFEKQRLEKIHLRNSEENKRYHYFQNIFSKTDKQANMYMTVFEISKDLQKSENLQQFLRFLRVGISAMLSAVYTEIILAKHDKEEQIQEDIIFNITDGTEISKENSKILNLSFIKNNNSKLSKENTAYLINAEKNEYSEYTGLSENCRMLLFPITTFEIPIGYFYIKRGSEFFEKYEIDCLLIFINQLTLIYRNLQLMNKVNKLITYDSMTGLAVHNYFKQKNSAFTIF